MDVKKGTTTVALVFKDGVVLAADKRVSMGYHIAHKNAQKVLTITDYIGVTTAGSVGDIQSLVGYLKAEAKLYEIKNSKRMSPKALAKLTAAILQGQRYYPLYAWLVLGGVDSERGYVYSIDPIGGVSEDKMVATGSGMEPAYGVLDDRYRDNMDSEAAVKLAVRALLAAISRNMGTGDGVNVIKITQDGTKELTSEEIDKVIASIKEEK
ncbi:MAG: archaeal proteasome endopeptidase complex subunit beta [Candidatus Methanofastidiosa archaeon]|nr:archaeal proteasome endopeptidase complex subunit beta [Candidatus Methanofastidiosa archaeon]